jgi:hypothetical protein
VRDLLFDGVPEVAESGIAEPVDVQQQKVKVEPFGPVGRSWAPVGEVRLVRRRLVPVQRFPVVFVLRAVVRAPGRSGQRRIEMGHGIVRRLGPRGFDPGAPERGQGIDLSPQVGMHGSFRVLELTDGAPRDILDD